MNKLTPIQSELLKILESFMHDKAYEFPEDFRDTEKLEQLFKLAQIHSLASVAFEQTRFHAVWQQEQYRGFYAFCKRSAVREVMLQMQRAEGFLSIYEKLTAEGLRPLVMKGIICRNLYTKSDYRTSSDEDMLLSKECFSVCDKILRENGFSREELEEEADKGISVEKLPHEIPYINKQNGTYIELHFTLFAEDSDLYVRLNREFALVHENRVAETVNGKEVWTLCPTEHLFYLVCHAFKHFLAGGIGVRQIADMIMMAEHYGGQIDWEDLLDRVERNNMKSFWDALIQIGLKYLGFSPDKAMYPMHRYNENIDCYPLLLDLLDAGIYGDSSMERKHSANMTITAVNLGKANTAASVGASLFPKMDYMKRSYKWLDKYPWLLPVAYLQRILRYLKMRNKDGQAADGTGNGNSIQIGVERVELLKKYDIIK